MKKTIFKSALLAIVSVGLMAGSASAVLITGDISFSGGTGDYMEAYDSSSNVTTDLSVAAGINFYTSSDAPGYVGPIDLYNAEVDLASGDFLSLLGTGANFSSGTFNPFVGPFAIWQAGNFSFVLDSINIITQIPDFLSISGTGLAYNATDGFEATGGSFFFSTQRGGTWSANTEAVPEPATMLLFGTGLVGLAGLRRKKGQKKA